MRLNVTIARQLGCGGSILGQALAETLNVRCLDRDILSHTAQRLSCKETDVASYEETAPSFWERVLVGFNYGPPEAVYVPEASAPPSLEEVFQAETEVMKTIAAEEDCVIVGRAAVHVLPPHPGLINLYLYAPLSYRIARVMEYKGYTTAEQARALIARSDSQRQKFVSNMTGRDSGDASNYHLCLDTSALPMEENAQILVDFIQRRLAAVKV